MFKVLGTLAFLVLIYCVVMLLLSIFNRRMNNKLWIIVLIISAVVLIVSYYVDISGENYSVKFSSVTEQYE